MRLLPALALLFFLQPLALGLPTPADKTSKGGSRSGSGRTSPVGSLVPSAGKGQGTLPAASAASGTSKGKGSGAPPVATPAPVPGKDSGAGTSGEASSSAAALGSKGNPFPDPRAAEWDAFRPVAPGLGIQKDLPIELERHPDHPDRPIWLSTSFSGHIKVPAGINADDHAVLSYYAHAAMRQMQRAHKNIPNAMIAMAMPENRILLASSFSIPGLLRKLPEAEREKMSQHGVKVIAELDHKEKDSVGEFLVACLNDPATPRQHKAGAKCGEINVLRLDRDIQRKEKGASYTYEKPGGGTKIAAWVKNSPTSNDKGKTWNQVEGIDDPCVGNAEIPGQFGCKELVEKFKLKPAKRGQGPSSELSKLLAKDQSVALLPNPRKAA